VGWFKKLNIGNLLDLVADVNRACFIFHGLVDADRARA
jgi:hypothetical protein